MKIECGFYAVNKKHCVPKGLDHLGYVRCGKVFEQMTDIERNKAGKKLFTVNGTDEVQLYDGTKINMNPELLTDIDRKIDELAHVIFNADTEYDAKMILKDQLLALINEQVRSELKDFRKNWHTMIRQEVHQDLNDRIAKLTKLEAEL